jgi:hypothetical protein
VQVSFATPQAPVTTVSASYAEAQTAGDTNILAIGWNDTVSKITSVTDSAGNVYDRAVRTFRGNGLSQAIYDAADIAGSPAGATEVSVTFDRPATFVDLRITEYAGLRRAAPFDSGVSATGVGTEATTSSLDTLIPSELLFAAGMTSAVFTAPGPGFETRVITDPDGDIVEDSVAYEPGSYQAAASLRDGTWVLQLAAFLPEP